MPPLSQRPQQQSHQFCVEQQATGNSCASEPRYSSNSVGEYLRERVCNAEGVFNRGISSASSAGYSLADIQTFVPWRALNSPVTQTIPDDLLTPLHFVEDHRAMREFEPDETTCIACQETVEVGQIMTRLYCKHVMHQKCWRDWSTIALTRMNLAEREGLTSRSPRLFSAPCNVCDSTVFNSVLECPICRGPGYQIATWRHGNHMHPLPDEPPQQVGPQSIPFVSDPPPALMCHCCPNVPLTVDPQLPSAVWMCECCDRLHCTVGDCCAVVRPNGTKICNRCWALRDEQHFHTPIPAQPRTPVGTTQAQVDQATTTAVPSSDVDMSDSNAFHTPTIADIRIDSANTTPAGTPAIETEYGSWPTPYPRGMSRMSRDIMDQVMTSGWSTSTRNHRPNTSQLATWWNSRRLRGTRSQPITPPESPRGENTCRVRCIARFHNPTGVNKQCLNHCHLPLGHGPHEEHVCEGPHRYTIDIAPFVGNRSTTAGTDVEASASSSVSSSSRATMFAGPTMAASAQDADLWERGGSTSINGVRPVDFFKLAKMYKQKMTQSYGNAQPTVPGEKASGHNDAHQATRLLNGCPALLIDTGSRGNLVGDEWVQHAAAYCKQFSETVEEHRRTEALNVVGVGNGSQQCNWDTKVPICLRRSNDPSSPATGKFTSPTIRASPLPALWGNHSLMQSRALIDLFKMKLHLQGPGGSNIDLSSGTVSVDLVLSPSGHLMVPCCEFQQLAQLQDDNRMGGVHLDTATDLALASQDMAAHNVQASDRWEKHGHLAHPRATVWRRRHMCPRRSLFTPSEGDIEDHYHQVEHTNAPAVDDISCYRKTTAIFFDGSTEIIEDNWHDADCRHRNLGRPWTGVTEFHPVGVLPSMQASGGYIQYDRI